MLEVANELGSMDLGPHALYTDNLGVEEVVEKFWWTTASYWAAKSAPLLIVS
jgi:hypothetical protein